MSDYKEQEESNRAYHEANYEAARFDAEQEAAVERLARALNLLEPGWTYNAEEGLWYSVDDVFWSEKKPHARIRDLLASEGAEHLWVALEARNFIVSHSYNVSGQYIKCFIWYFGEQVEGRGDFSDVGSAVRAKAEATLRAALAALARWPEMFAVGEGARET